MIRHLPDTAAHEIIVTVNFPPVGFHISGADAHGVGVLAHKIGAVVEPFLFPPPFSHIVNHLHCWVHLTAHVVGLPLAVNGAFVMDRQGRAGFQVIIHCVGVAIASGLVAQRPHDNGSVRVEFVALVEAGDSVQIALPPFWVVGDGVVGRRKLMGECAVGFQVVFVHDVQAVQIRQLQQKRVRGVVGSADGVNVKLFAQERVPLDFVRRHGIAVYGTAFVVVHSVELDFPAVEQKHVAFDFHGTESDLLFDAGGGRLIVNGVERGRFRVPLRHGEIFKDGGGALPLGGNRPRF